jgi:hypothetical protein
MTAPSACPRPPRLKPVLSALVLGAITLLGAAPAIATTHDGKPKILLHAQPVVAKNKCASGYIANCQEAVTQGNLNTYYNVFVVGARGNLPDLNGLQFGLDYQGGVDMAGGLTPISVFSWTLCGHIELVSPTPAWPAPGCGTILILDNYQEACNTNEVAVGGYFYMAAYEPATMRITERPVDHVLKVARCNSTEVIMSDPDDAGIVSFSDSALPGCNPCNAPCTVVAVAPATWSRIKATAVGP